MTRPVGRYSPVPGEPFRWLEPRVLSLREIRKRELFPNGIPLRGDLTPEQEAWLMGR